VQIRGRWNQGSLKEEDPVIPWHWYPHVARMQRMHYGFDAEKPSEFSRAPNTSSSFICKHYNLTFLK